MTRIDTLRAEIEEREKEIQSIQEECSHPRACLKKEYGASTGNYDPSSDHYWIDFECGLCGKQWSEDQ